MSSASEKRFETLCSVTLAVLATLLSIIDLAAGKFGDDELIAINEKAAAFQWYQSKSIKEAVVEQQIGLLQALTRAGAIQPTAQGALAQDLTSIEGDLQRYKKEKAEILKGSAAVGKENWVQERDGQLGQITGALEWQAEAERLGKAGDTFDLSVLFLQVSLVLGAISLVLDQLRLRNLFYGLMVFLGSVGTVLGVLAWMGAAG